MPEHLRPYALATASPACSHEQERRAHVFVFVAIERYIAVSSRIHRGVFGGLLEVRITGHEGFLARDRRQRCEVVVLALEFPASYVIRLSHATP